MTARSEPTSALVQIAPQTSAARGALAALALLMLLPSLAMSSANVALPVLSDVFNATFQQMQWVILAYLLASTTSMVSVGKFGDIIGRRRLLLGGIAIFTLASLVCGSVATLGWLIAARVGQGMGAAILLALAIAMVGETVPKAKTGSAMGLLGAMSAIGTALGPSLGGVLLAGLGWRAIFLINLPLGIVALLLATRYLPAQRPLPRSEPRRFDGLGTLLLILTLGTYTLALTLGRGQFTRWNLVLLLAAILGAAILVCVETKVPTPLLPLPLIRTAPLRRGLLLSLVVSAVVMTTLVVGPFYLSQGLGLAATGVGLVMSVGPVVAALTSVPAGKIVDRLGVRRLTSLGLLGLGSGCALLALLPAALGVAGYVAAITLMTSGYALFQAANNTAVMADVPAEQRGVISGLLNLSRNLGFITGTAGLGAVFALATNASDLRLALPEHITQGMGITFGVAAGLVGIAWGNTLRREKGS